MISIRTSKAQAHAFPTGKLAALVLYLAAGLLFSATARAQGLAQQYRVEIEVGAGTAARQDKPIDAAMDLTAFLASIPGTLDVQSLQVVEVDIAGTLLNESVLFQFDQDPAFDPTANAAGNLVFIMDGVTPAGTTRFYQLAFDLAGVCPDCPAPPIVANPVSVDSLTYENQLTYEVTTPQATYRYHKQGAGLASLIDNDAQDWISFRDIPGSNSAGEYRGIPNLVFNSSDTTKRFFHPGFTNGTSQLISAGPLKVVVRSQAGPPENFWDVLWEFYPDYARLTVLSAGPANTGPYWFLYEGTIGGGMDAGDVVVRSDGTQTSAFDYGAVWEENLTPPEWVYFRDTASTRALFISDDMGDGNPDSYRPLGQTPGSDPEMTVFGFGRVLNTSPNSLVGRLSGANRSFTMGFVEDHTVADAEITGAAEPVTVLVGAAGVPGTPVARDDEYATPENSPLVVAALTGVLANDTDDGPLTAVLQDDAANGLLNLNADGSFDYTPDLDFVGTDSFTYRASDGVLDALATVTIDVVGSGDPDALAILPLDEGSGLVAGDVGGAGNDGTLAGGAVFEATSGDGSASSVRFDGLDDYIDLGPLDASGSGLTLASWFNADAFPGASKDPRIISKATSVSGNDHVFMLGTIQSGAEVRLRGRVRVGGVTTTVIASSGNLATGQWYHAALTHDGATLRLYLDGALVGSGALVGAVDQDPTVPVVVGSQPPGAGPRFFDGLIDGVHILQRGLDAGEVLALAAGNQPPVAVNDGYATPEDAQLVVAVANGVLDNDSDAEGDPLTAVLQDNAANGALVLNADGSFTYTPNADFSGTDSFTYRAFGAGVGSNLATVILTVDPLNDAPVAVDDSYEAAPNTVLSVAAAAGVLQNDTDVDLDPLQAILVDNVTDGVLTLNADGSFDYTPILDFTGLDSFTYRASDTVLDSLATVTINVVPPPTALADNYGTDEDVALVVPAGLGVLINDEANNPADGVTAVLLTGPANGTLTSFGADGGFVYTPDADFNGGDSFTYLAVDGGTGATAAATVTLAIAAVNDSPVAVGDSYETAPNTPLTVGAAAGVLDNDSDVDLDALQAVLQDDVANGVLTLNTDGSFDYTPNLDFTGTDGFTYQASDGVLDALAAVTIEVADKNDPDTIVLLPLDEGSGLVAGDVGGAGNDGTLEGGAVFEPTSGDGSASSVRFDGVDDYIDLGVLDAAGSGLTLASWFNADAYPGPSNDPRIISKATSVSGNDHVFMLGTIRSGAAIRLRGRVRVGGVTTTVIASSGNLATGQWYHAALTHDGSTLRLYLDGVQVGSGALVGAVDQDPAVPVAVGNQPPGAGPRSFDGLLDDVRILQRALDAGEVLALAAGNQPPVAVNDGYTTPEDAQLVVAAANGVLGNDNDAEGDPLTAVLQGNAANGALVLNADGSFTYTPNADFSGTDSFTYRAFGAGVGSNLATVILTVDPLNDAPVAVDDSYEAAPNTVLSVAAAAGVLQNDTDVDLDPLQAVLVDDVGSGVLALNPDGSFAYTPDLDFSGLDGFTYRASDGALDSLATVTINVVPLPTAVDDFYATDEDLTLVIPAGLGVLINDEAINPIDGVTAVLLTGPANGTLTNFGADGGFVYTPDADFNGGDSFTYLAVDGGTGATAQATVTLTVNPINDAPVALADVYQAGVNTPLTVGAAAGVLDNDSDVDLDALQAVLQDDVTNGVLTLNIDGSFDYTPSLDFVGTDGFTYRASDGVLDALAAVTIEVADKNDPDTIVLLPLDEGSGLVAGDVGGAGNDGTLEGGAVFEPTSGDGSASSVRFDGVDDYIDLGVLDAAGSGLTLASWFNADAYPGPSNDPRIISKATSVSGNDHVFMLGTIRSGAAIRLRGRVRVGGVTTTVIASSGNLATGQWYHAALTHDGSTLRLYLDGVQVGSGALVGAVDQDPAVPVAVGNQPPGAGPRSFDGLLDDVRILQRGLDAGEVLALAAGNQPPVAVNDGYTTPEDAQLVVAAANGVLGNDNDAEGDPLTAVLQGNAANGALVLNADGSFTYTPNADFSGTDSFTYRAFGAGVGSNLATVTLTIDPLNDAPVAVDDSYEAAPNTVLSVAAAAGVLQNDTDVDLDPLQAILVTDVANGVLALNADGSFDYTPTLDFTGLDSFTYRASDTVLDSLATVTINVVPPPTAQDDVYAAVEDVPLVVPAASGVLSNDEANIPADGVTAVLLTGPTAGTLPGFGADGSFTYVADPDFYGLDSFTYLAVDGGTGATAQATVTLAIAAVNDTPVAVGDSYETTPNTPLAVNAASGVLDNDSDVDLDALQAVLQDDVTSGVLSLNTDGSFSYTPNLDFTGLDSFTYLASDGVLDAPATVTISVTGGGNTPPRFVTGGTGFLARQVIGSGVDETHAVVAADFDGDGDIDAAATDFFDDSVFWYEHDGNGGYTERTVDAALDGAYPLSVGDVDLDGDPDLLACGYDGDTVVWYENDGFANFTRRDVDTAADGAHSVVIGDLDQDGDIDLVTTNQDGNSVWWYENTGGETFVRIEIDTTATGAKRAEIADVDGDGDWDIVSAAYFTDLIAWHENDGNENFTRRTIDNTVDGPYFVTPVDVDNDGDIDVLSASRLGNSIKLHINDGSGNFTNQALDMNAQGARMVITADVDGDGDPDAIASSVLDDTIALFENDGSGNFTEVDAIDLGADGAYGLFAVDADLDGDIDVMSANRDADNVALHRQVRLHSAQLANNTATLIVDASVVAASDTEQGAAQLIFTLTNPPQTGELRLNGTAVLLNGTFTQDDINNARVTYVPNGVELYQDEFTFTVSDGVGDGFTPTTGVLTVQFADVPTAAVAHWPLDESSGTTAVDLQGGFNGTLAGDPVWLPGGGRIGGALELDGTGDQVDIGPIDIPAGNGMTAALWLRPAVAGSYERLLSKATGVAEQDHYWMVSLAPNGALRFRLKAGGVTSTLLTPTGLVSVGAWYHVACTYDKQFMRIYGNGVLVASLPKTGALDVNAAVAATIGNQPPGAGDDPFVGALDEVRLYFKALTEAEITALADPGTGGPVPEAPVITTTAVTTAIAGQPYTYDVAASGYPSPTFSLTTNPAGMTIDVVTGLISWTPAAPGDQTVDVLATNSEGTDNQLYTVSVLPAPNVAPTVAVTDPSPGAVFLLGDPVPLTATADDTDGTVTQVEFLVDGAVLTTLFSPPWTTVWNGAAVGTHVIVARATDNESAVTASQAVPINVNDPSVPSRVDAGLVALYKFATGNGSVVQDVSGAGTPLDLTINDPGAVTWLPGGGLTLDASTIVKTAGPATKMIDAVTTSDAITVEAWLTPTQLAQTGPARIVTCSSTLTTRNFTLGHEGSGSNDRYVMRLRTSTTTTNGTPETATDNGTLTADLTHVVYTRDAAGLVTIYLDGGLSRTGFTYGSTTNWDASYAFALGNELTEDRPWLGTYFLVAVYDRALTQAEIVQNNSAGPYGQPVPAAPVITSTPVVGGTLGQLYQYDVEASGYPAPAYSLVTSPAGMTIDAGTGVISWTPAATGIQSVEVAASSPEGTDTQVFDVTVYSSNPVQIAFWHGSAQRVGHLGPAQADFNVLGKVSPVADVTTLDYKLNSGQYQPLTIGPDFLRLAAAGDFNADIPIVLLDVGPNVVTIRAVGTTGQITTATMTVTVETGGDYTLPATIAWSGVSDPQDVGQYVDGLWQLDNGALDVVEPGYDRIFLVGNENWQDYETLVPITINDVTRTGAGLGILMRFTGHIVGGHRNWPVTQPKMGYQPFGAIGWLRWVNGATVDPRIQFYPGDSDFAKTEWDISAAIGPADGAGDDAEPLPFGDPSQVIDFGSLAMVTGETFWMKMRCETLPDSTNGWGKTRYSYKVWRSTVSEPASWDFSETQVSEHALRLGGVALLAHHVDATFGDVQVTAIPPSTAVTSLAFNKAGDEGSVGPKRFALHQNHPNPFNPQTNIALDVPRESRVGVRIYDIRGRAVRNLFTGNLPPGTHTFKWDGRDDSGRGAAGGIYFLRMVAGEHTATRKMTLVR